MAQDIVNENQRISYTNQDFSSIYPEVLDMIKQLTYKWDPSISDESDPGVILVKLSALIADKCNYNIDKSILEAFPLSVTQDSNARQLYDQLGYYMDWYESATAPITINWITDPVTDTSGQILSYTIPRFTIITDNESLHNYTLVGVNGVDGIVVSDTVISTDGKSVQVVAMEGTPVKYTYQGETVITPQMIDPITRRLYFTTPLVSQNGVFIKNTGQENYTSWKRVNNLYEQSYNELRYTFGFDSKSNLCYIEFPDNYAELFGSGIEITYLIISDVYDNIPAQQLTKFLSPVTIKPSVAGVASVTLDSRNVKIVNYAAASGHKDKESINDAYTNYRKTVGTFKTLITLRDYLNYIRDEEAEICSNAFVCDRTNDIQTVYKIISKQNDLDTLIIKIEQIVNKTKVESNFDYKFVKTSDFEPVSGKDYYIIKDNNTIEKVEIPGEHPSEEGYYELSSVEPIQEDAMTPFSLKFYLLRNAISLNTKSAYDETFNMIHESPNIDTLLEDTAHLEHTYEDILPLGKNSYKKSSDKYFSDTKSYYKYDTNIEDYVLISREEIDYYSNHYEEVGLDSYLPGKSENPSSKNWYETVEGEKVLTTDTFARVGQLEDDSKVFFIQASITGDSNPVELGWYEYNSSNNRYILTSDISATPGKMYYVLKVYYEKRIGSPEEHIDIYEVDVEAMLPHTVFFKNVYPIELNISTYEILDEETQTIIMQNVIKALYEQTNSKEVEFGEGISLEYLTKVVESSDDRIRNVTFDNIVYTTYAIYYDEHKAEFVEVALDSDMSTVSPSDYQNETEVLKAKFKKDILAKSILCGTTQLLVPDSTFTYHLSQQFMTFVNDVYAIKSEAEIDMGRDGSTSYAMDNDDSVYVRKTYKLKENETLSLFRPALSSVKEFLSGVHFEYLLYKDIKAEESYQLGRGEYFVLYKPVTDETDAIIGYTAFACANGAIINPSSALVAQTSLSSLTGFTRGRIIPYFETHKGTSNSTQLKKDEISKGASHYEITTYNDTYMTEIRNNASITNNVITGSDSIAIQLLNTAEFSVDDKYKFFWVLNTPTYSNDNNLRTYTLFQGFDSNEESGVDVNSYTLKSGEYLYYTDHEERDLAILGPGTILTRNCGVKDFDYKKVFDSLYFKNFSLLDPDEEGKFQFFQNAGGTISPIKNGFYSIVNDPQPYSNTEPNRTPKELCLYEYDSDFEFYILTEDEEFLLGKEYFDNSIFVRSTDESIEPPGTQYYLLLMHKNPGWYRRTVKEVLDDGTEVYDYIQDSVNAPAFSEVNVQDSEELINPKDLGLYEVVSDIIEDVYSINETEPEMSHDRYAVSLDEKIIHRNILQDIPEYAALDISDLKTYSYFDLISEDVLSNYDATSKGLNLKSPIYKEYFEKVGNTFTPINNDDIFCLDNPSMKLWYEWNPTRTGYIQTQDTSPIIEGIKNPVNPLIFREIGGLSFEDSFKDKGYFYKANTSDGGQDYIYDAEKEKVYLNANDVSYMYQTVTSPLEYLYAGYTGVTTPYDPTINNWLNFIDGVWDQYITYTKPSTWATNLFNEEGQWTEKPASYDNYYVALTASVITNTSVRFDSMYPAFTYTVNPDDKSFVDSEFYVKASYLDVLGITPSTASPVKYFTMTDKFNYLDSDLKLGRLFPNKASTLMMYGNIQMYYLPGVFRLNDFVAYTKKQYYEPKNLFTKIFGTIDAWTCSALNINDIAEKPLETISNLWRNIQYNTSLTITESELWSFSTDDSIILESKDSTNTSLNWPVFTNHEVVLDTDKYNIAYQRNGSEIKDLEALDVEGYSWQGYSNLLLNTASNNGQRLYPNQSIYLFNDNSDKPLASVRGEADSDVTFQLKYPIANVSGDFIKVDTLNTLGESMLNSLYAFKSLPNGDYYKYTTDVYDTYLYFNSKEAEVEEDKKNITVPVAVPYGNYLLPLISKSGVTLKAEYLQTSSTTDEDYNIRLVPVEIETPIGGMKFTGEYNPRYLHSYIDKDVTEFTGDKYQFIYLQKDEYELINLPSYLSMYLDKSPADLNWYELDENSEYVESTDEGKGTDLIELIIPEFLNASQNPSELGWYELEDDIYVLSKDTKVNTDKKYYRDKKFFIDLINVNSNVKFSINNDYEKEVTFIIRDIFRFSNNPALGNDFDKVWDSVKALDTNSDYNYTFVPNSNDLITNPLDPKAFWNTNHVYNPFTIAQLDFNGVDYKFINSK